MLYSSLLGVLSVFSLYFLMEYIINNPPLFKEFSNIVPIPKLSSFLIPTYVSTLEVPFTSIQNCNMSLLAQIKLLLPPSFFS